MLKADIAKRLKEQQNIKIKRSSHDGSIFFVIFINLSYIF